MNKKLQTLIIAIVIALAGFFGYNVIVNPPVNIIPSKIDTIQNVQVDTLLIDTLK